MRLTASGATNRNAWYDRNAATKQFNGGTGAVGPHGITTRATYTVPAGRKFQGSALYAAWERVTVAAPVGQYAIRVSFTPSGGSLGNPLVVQTFIQNSVASNKQMTLPGYALNAGDLFQLETFDLSTGGTVDYNSSLVGTEYDA